jgi:hypothetical protein
MEKNLLEKATEMRIECDWKLIFNLGVEDLIEIGKKYQKLSPAQQEELDSILENGLGHTYVWSDNLQIIHNFFNEIYQLLDSRVINPIIIEEARDFVKDTK